MAHKVYLIWPQLPLQLHLPLCLGSINSSPTNLRAVFEHSKLVLASGSLCLSLMSPGMCFLQNPRLLSSFIKFFAQIAHFKRDLPWKSVLNQSSVSSFSLLSCFIILYISLFIGCYPSCYNVGSMIVRNVSVM